VIVEVSNRIADSNPGEWLFIKCSKESNNQYEANYPFHVGNLYQKYLLVPGIFKRLHAA
jgi:hypothetical protein